MNGTILIYGATGYTGKLIAKAAVDRGARPILAARNLGKVKALAEPLGLMARAFDLGDPAHIDAAIKDISVLLCVAGPFSATSRPVADACVRNRVHYLDITGEIDVFEALAGRDAEAKARGVTLLPGVGFDVVPSDCLAAHLKRRLPDAKDLKLYLSLGANMSRGTAKTMIEAIAVGTRLRRKGRIVSRDQAESGSCDFGEGEKPTIQVSWGDVATAFHSTGIPNIEVQFEELRAIRAFARTPWFVKSFLGLDFMQSFLKARVDRLPEGPSEAARRAARHVLVGVARNEKGQTVSSKLRTPEGYPLTAETALDAARRVTAGEVKPGFQTPSLAFGADYILNFDGVAREDLTADPLRETRRLHAMVRRCQPLPPEAGTLDGSGCKPGYATAAGSSIGSITSKPHALCLRHRIGRLAAGACCGCGSGRRKCSGRPNRGDQELYRALLRLLRSTAENAPRRHRNQETAWTSGNP